MPKHKIILDFLGVLRKSKAMWVILVDSESTVTYLEYVGKDFNLHN